MKKMSFLFALLALNLNSFSQDVIKKTISYESGIKESFYVLKSNKNIKHGQYTMSSGKSIIKTGLYENGIKTGVWNYYSYNNLQFSYDFTSGIIISDTIGIVRPAIYSEGEFYLFFLLSKYIEYPVEALKANIQGKVLIRFLVEKDGTPKDFMILQGCGNLALNNEAVRVVKKIAYENPWYPGIDAKGEKIISIIALPVTFQLK